MRWVIVGPYPPERGEGPVVTAAVAAAHLDAGDQVTVISPRPSAAHHHRELVGREALRRLHADVGPGDGFWARVEPGILLTRSPSRVEAILERVLLRRVLRRAGRSVLDVGDVALFPGGRAGALVFDSVDQLVVHDLAERDALVAAGASPHKVVLHDEAPAPQHDEQGSGTTPAEVVLEVPPPVELQALPADAGRAAIEAAVRRRAADAPLRRGSRS